MPDMDDGEEYVQANSSLGKVFKVYHEDYDGDGIPNVEDMDAGGLFVPLVVMSHPSATTAKYKFDFDNDIRIWVKNGNSGQRTNDFITAGGNLIESEYEYEYSELFTDSWSAGGKMNCQTLYIEGLTNGTQNISCEYILEDTTLYTEAVTVSVIDASLVPDYDLDGDIDNDDLFRYSTNEVYRFWINDDDDDPDSEDSGDDNPGSASEDSMICIQPTGGAPEYYYQIDGVRDFIDFFAVNIAGLQETVNILPSSDYDYYLKHVSGAVNVFIAPGLTSSEADYHLYNKTFCEANKTTRLLYDIDTEFCINANLSALVYNNESVMLLEGCVESTSPLVLEIRRKSDDSVVYSTILRLSLSSVKDMYRTLDLRGGTSYTGQPANYPDSLCNATNLFFLHGFKVTEADSHGWNSEFFKRLYWSGSNAKFWGVTWPGDTGTPTALNFHENAADAFNTASNLYYATTSVSNKTFIAHSLGNMVVSAAIEDYGLDVDKYFMLNCAVPSEAYDSSLASTATNNNYMLHEDWEEYLPRTWASQWYELFDSTDNRCNLTWRGRFANVVSNAYNYYSSGDEVLEIDDGTPDVFSGGLFHLERYAWHKQEIFKGTSIIGGTSWAGWGFFRIFETQYYDVASANAASTNDLLDVPVFAHYPWNTLMNTNMTNDEVDEMLTMGIPSLSYPAGRKHIAPDDDGFSFDMNSSPDTFRLNGWLNRGAPYGTRWLHNDLKNVAYVYNYSLFDKIVDDGELE